MLVLSRKVGERIQLGDQITITLVKINGNAVRLGIDAPPEMSVVRQELVVVRQELAEHQRPYGERQAELGRKQAALGELQRHAGEQAGVELRRLADDAIERGVAERVRR